MIDFGAQGIRINPSGVAEQRVPCPNCARSRRDDALGVNIETGAYHCFRCGMKGRARVVRDVGRGNAATNGLTRIDDPQVEERKRDRLRATWRDTVPLGHRKAHAVRAYLQTRALGDILKEPPAALRAHAGLQYWDGHTLLGQYPAMVAMFRSAAGEPVTLHVTWLRHDGCAKAPVPAPKKILGVPVKGATRGGAIRLYEPRAGVLGIAEGIESALSLHLIAKIPVWASFCADNLARLRLPTGLRELRIGVDIDDSGKGRQVARALVNRVKQWSPRTRCYYVTPEIAGVGDLNDEMLKRGAR